MRILISSGSMHFSDTFPAGETQIAYGIARHLAGLGHRVTVFSPRVTLTERVEGLDAIELCPGDTPASGRSYAEEKLLWWKFSLKARREAKKLLQNERVDVIHHLMPAHEGKFSLLTGLGIPLVFGPMLLTWEEASHDGGFLFHGLREELCAKCADRLDMHVGKRLYRRTLFGARVILVSTGRLKQVLDVAFAGRTALLPYGVDTSVFHPNGGPPPGAPIILYLGLLAERKGITDLIRAFSILRSRVDARLEVVGGGDGEGIMSLARDLGVGDAVNVIGEVPHREVSDYFRRCAIFCLPSHGEPFGMVLLQAMASGKPVVATRGGGVEEIVEDGNTGILVDQKKPAALACAIETLLRDPVMRERMGESGRKKAVDAYEWRVIVRRLESIYERARGG